MLIVGLLSWWYGAGWKRHAVLVFEKIDGVSDFFSIGLLFRSLFSPFRQISAGRVSGPIGAQLRAFFDQLISRIIGAIVRTVLIIIGLIAVSLYSVYGLIVIILWAIVPLLPFIGMVMSLTGWTFIWK